MSVAKKCFESVPKYRLCQKFTGNAGHAKHVWFLIWHDMTQEQLQQHYIKAKAKHPGEEHDDVMMRWQKGGDNQ